MGLGAVLSQVRVGEEHPVTYISRKLLPNEKNYSTVEKEALAIKWALDKLRYYLLGLEFTLVTDHAPLMWMASAKDSNARVTRWFLALQDNRFQVDYRPGREHANVDALSHRDACLWALTRPEASTSGGGVWEPDPKPSRQAARGRGGGWHIPPITTSRRQRASSDSP